MGGKGGGGDEPGWVPIYRAEQARLAKEKSDADAAASAKATADAAAAAQKTVDDAKAAPAATTTSDTPAAAAAAAEPPPANNTLAPSIGGGGTTVDPNSPFGTGSGTTTAGDTLGGSVLNPPKYWTGNIGNYKPAPTSQAKKGSMSTTQT